jgi:hypothetical protein
MTERVEARLGRVPPGPGHARGKDLQDIHPAGGHTQQDNSIVYGGTFYGCSHRQQFGSQIGKFLQENRDIFAWKPTDMPGVSRELIKHELHLDLKARPVNQ